MCFTLGDKVVYKGGLYYVMKIDYNTLTLYNTNCQVITVSQNEIKKTL